MMTCEYCGGETRSLVVVDHEHGYQAVCADCMRKLRQDRIEKELASVSQASDFASWKKEDMSEAFWMHLIRYQKCPNQRSLSIMRTAFLWACHDDHGLSNCFSHALKWCGIDFFAERLKDLPETDT